MRVALAATLALLLTLPTVLAVSGTTVAHLPQAVTGSAGAVAGGTAFVLGGRLADGNYSNGIVAYDGATATTVGALPRATGATHDGIRSTAAASVGGLVFAFGGAAMTEATLNGQPTTVPIAVRDIIVFDPATGGARKTLDQLPDGVWGMAAVASGSDVYLFGGFTFDVTSPGTIARHDWVLHYDASAPEGTRLTELAARLPYGVQDAGAALVGGTAFVLGGLHDNATAAPCTYDNGNGTRYLLSCVGSGIIAFDVATRSVQGVVADLPQAVQWPGSASLDGVVYAVGGRLADGTPSGSVVAFDPTTGSVRPSSGCVGGLYAAPVAPLASDLYRFGGRGAGVQDVFDDILRIDLASSPGAEVPGAPALVSGTRDDAGVHLSWSPPACSGGDVTSYVVQRADVGGAFETIGTTSGTRFVDATATAGVPYDYRVAAVNAAGQGAFSAVARVAAVPSAPRDLSATSDLVLPRPTTRLSWDVPVSDGGAPIDHYVVLRTVGRGTETPIGNAWGTSFTDRAPPLARHATYRVVAVNSAGAGAPSEAVTVTLAERLT